MESKRSFYRNQFVFFVNGFMAVLSLSLAVYAIYVAGGRQAMIQPLPPIVLALLGLAFVFAIMAIISAIRMFTSPKDTRLDELITAVKELKQNATEPNVSIQTKIDTADISEMNVEQLKAVSDFINELTQKETSK
jgi:ABC-type Fe3+-siderophore transport system permease subunit